MKFLFQKIYITDMKSIVQILACIIIFWTVAAFLFCVRCGKRTLFSGINMILSVACTAAILYTTVITRSSNTRELLLTPFYSFSMARRLPEYYRTLFMNVILFIPVGLFLPYAYADKGDSGKFRKFLFVLLAGFLLSLLIEILQFALMRGKTEADDVIMNTLGTLLGESSYLLFSLLERMTRKGKGNQT